MGRDGHFVAAPRMVLAAGVARNAAASPPCATGHGADVRLGKERASKKQGRRQDGSGLGQRGRGTPASSSGDNGSGHGTRLVIVESPAKARTIAGYLGKGYVVESSIGHIRDMPDKAAEIPERYRA